jgi:hypothetical protein
MPRPKQRHLGARVAHRGTCGTLDEFKAAWVGRLAHHGGTPKILPGNLPPATIADRGISLQPYPPQRRRSLVGNLTYRIDWHRVLQKRYEGAVGGTPAATPVAAYPVCSGHAKHTRYGHGVPEMYLQRGCEIPAVCPGSWDWDVVVIGAPRYVPRDHEDLITATMERMTWRSSMQSKGMVVLRKALSQKTRMFLRIPPSGDAGTCCLGLCEKRPRDGQSPASVYHSHPGSLTSPTRCGGESPIVRWGYGIVSPWSRLRAAERKLGNHVGREGTCAPAQGDSLWLR